MKAKEYYAKYRDRLLANDIQFTDEEKAAICSSEERQKEAEEKIRKSLTVAVSDLIVEMSKEVQEICKVRHAKSNFALVAIIREMNDRWNKVGDMLNEKDKTDILEHDGLLGFWLRQMPELKMVIELENDKKKRRTQQ